VQPTFVTIIAKASFSVATSTTTTTLSTASQAFPQLQETGPVTNAVREKLIDTATVSQDEGFEVPRDQRRRPLKRSPRCADAVKEEGEEEENNEETSLPNQVEFEDGAAAL
jgi:hypothetical protein